MRKTNVAITGNGGGLAMPDIETSIRNNLPMAGSDQTYVGGFLRTVVLYSKGRL